MYHVLMLHLIGETAMYLGAVGLVTPSEDDEPVSVIEELWQRFQQSQPEADHLFIDWLEQQNEASEVGFADDAPNLPLQVYLRV